METCLSHPQPPATDPTAVSTMQRGEELSEEFTYTRVSTLERGGGTLGRRGDRGVDRRPERGERDRPERDSYTVDVRASDLQLAQPEPLKHPCFSYRAWLYSVLIGVRRTMETHERIDHIRPSHANVKGRGVISFSREASPILKI